MDQARVQYDNVFATFCFCRGRNFSMQTATSVSRININTDVCYFLTLNEHILSVTIPGQILRNIRCSQFVLFFKTFCSCSNYPLPFSITFHHDWNDKAACLNLL